MITLYNGSEEIKLEGKDESSRKIVTSRKTESVTLSTL